MRHRTNGLRQVPFDRLELHALEESLAGVFWGEFFDANILDDYGVRMEVQGEDTDKTLDKAHITVAKATAAKAVA